MRLAAPLLLGALVLAACGGDETRPTSVVAEADSADQTMFGFMTYGIQDGIRRSRIEAGTMYLFESRQASVMRNARVVFYDQNGVQASSLTSDRIEYNWQDNSMRAEGNVVLEGPEGRRLTSSVLLYNPGRNSISSDRPFVLVRGSERVEGEGFRADADFKNFVAHRPRAIAGDSLVLPGQ
jgi:LPS export ABC transporter protein LptC